MPRSKPYAVKSTVPGEAYQAAEYADLLSVDVEDALAAWSVTPANLAGMYGSTPVQTSSANSGGTSTLIARIDHVHKSAWYHTGVLTILTDNGDGVLAGATALPVGSTLSDGFWRIVLANGAARTGAFFLEKTVADVFPQTSDSFYLINLAPAAADRGSQITFAGGAAADTGADITTRMCVIGGAWIDSTAQKGYFTIWTRRANVLTEHLRVLDVGDISHRNGSTIHNYISQTAGTATVFNETGADIDFRVEGDTETSLLHLDASVDRVGIKISTPLSSLHILDNGANHVMLERTSSTARQWKIFVSASGNYVVRDETAGESIFAIFNNATSSASGISTAYVTHSLARTDAYAGVFSDIVTSHTGVMANNVFAGRFLVTSNHANNETAKLIGTSGIISFGASATGGTVTTASGMMSRYDAGNAAATKAVTTGILYDTEFTGSGTGVVTTMMGLYIRSMTVGSTRISIQSDDTSATMRHAGNAIFGGTGAPNIRVDIDGGLATRATSPSQITANQNDYAIGVGTFFRLSTDASRNITGMTGGVDGKRITVSNVGSFDIVFTNQDAASTAANRIITGTGASYTLPSDQSVEMVYDSTTSRWRVLN